ncbi:MAG: hypothetical protein APG12_01507 [Candidatus Methanofastidiosum methylothiophilum]|uniref:Gins51 C-terminal domain-containing protein n=1 Tax=Candidatus Methanofastidiosum methylothiophilum TaxID=1705564 RepID=A0A150IRX3_9EURY|nr:MAG: hypothetical protein APG10_01259 [Candidatus Methanofastidiosum methylthiophilus]KYC47791.1 MAG: hypothetical protein APG11_00869 [Candidatus Methanofastidiosum methylthiophilus]KYC49419.1 MAG: hypothetical protein APG12_01507 [Candidatus Methanofastidiosum methylthiophilus]
MRLNMGKHNEYPINIFRKECIKAGILETIGEDNKDILDLLSQSFDESTLEGKIKKAKSEYAKRKFEAFCRNRFRSIVDNSLDNLNIDNDLESRISKRIYELLNEYKGDILNTNIRAKEVREKVFKEVKLSQDVPEFIGEDMRSYGPYKKGEIISIPLRNAEILIREKVAES